MEPFHVGQAITVEYDSTYSCCHPIKAIGMVTQVTFMTENKYPVYRVQAACPIHGTTIECVVSGAYLSTLQEVSND